MVCHVTFDLFESQISGPCVFSSQQSSLLPLLQSFLLIPMLYLSQCFLSSQLILLAYDSLTMFIYLTFDENLSIKISSISLLLFFCLIIFFKCDDLDRILTVSDKLFMRVSFFPFVHFCFFQSDWWFMSHMFIKCLSLIDDDLSLMGLKVFLSLVNL